MNLPNLFLADLGPGLELGVSTLRDAAFAIRRNRDEWLLRQRTRTLVEIVAYVAEQWLDPSNGFRALALRDGPAETGFGPATLARGLEGFFRSLTVEGLEALIVQDLGDLRRLDEFSATPVELRGGRTSLAVGPDLMVHLTAGNLPNPALLSMVLGLLTRSAQVVKCPRRASLLPRLFAHSLAAAESKLGASMEIVSWSRDDRGAAELERVLFEEAGCVTATGGDALVEDVRRRVPARTRLVAYGHRVSFGFVAKESQSTYAFKRLVRAAADDVTAWNQLGCLSPHAYYVEEEAEGMAARFAEELAGELARREAAEPRGDIPVEEAAAIASGRAAYRLRAATQSGIAERNLSGSLFFETSSTSRIWESEGSTAWTVVLDGDPRFKASCLNRFVYVKPVRSFDEVLRYAEPVRHQLSTVALAVPDERLPAISRTLARWGATRLCPVGRMQEPPPTWRHDGRPSLADLVTWTDLET